jgi:protein-tyrosine phosphatase
MSEKIGVLFVCLGNICRSPTAEAAFRAEVERRQLTHRFDIDSCGTGGWHGGELAHHDTRATAKKRGIEITHRARQLASDDFERFDHLLVMDRSNETNVLRLATSPVHRAKVALFRSYDPLAESEGASGLEVPDPYYTGEFDRVFDICARTSKSLCDALLRAPTR